MKLKWAIVLALAVTLVFGTVTAAHAKWGDGWRSKEEPGEQGRERMRERIELMKMWKLTEVLDLDQETAAKLFPLVHEFDVKQQDLRKKRRDTIDKMREELKKDTPDSSVLTPLIAEFKKNEREMVDLRIQRLDSFSKLLSDEQVAKMLALIPMFERDVKEMLSEAHSMRRDRRMMRDRIHAPQEESQSGQGPLMGE